MATLIKERRVVADNWQLLESGAEFSTVPEQGDVIVPLKLWLAERDRLQARPGKLGVWLDSHEDPASVAADLSRFSVVAVNFPKFGDGRGYSTAALLRGRYGYKGELRAIGQVARDLLFPMTSCGFDAFAVRDGEDVQEALDAFADFSERYQASVTQPQPLFRRRFAAEKA